MHGLIPICIISSYIVCQIIISASHIIMQIISGRLSKYGNSRSMQIYSPCFIHTSVKNSRKSNKKLPDINVKKKYKLHITNKIRIWTTPGKMCPLKKSWSEFSWLSDSRGKVLYLALPHINQVAQSDNCVPLVSNDVLSKSSSLFFCAMPIPMKFNRVELSLNFKNLTFFLTFFYSLCHSNSLQTHTGT